MLSRGALCLVLLAAMASPSQAFEGRYAIQGRDALGAAYAGQGRITRSGAGYTLEARYAGGRPADVHVEAARDGAGLRAQLGSQGGLAAALAGVAGGSSGGDGDSLTLAVTRTPTGLQATWTRSGGGQPYRVERWTAGGASPGPAPSPATEPAPTHPSGPVDWLLGPSRTLPKDGAAWLAIPFAGGRLRFEGGEALRITVVGPGGATLESDARGGWRVRRAGAHQVRVHGAGGSLRARYTIAAATPDTPWNFWYFPFFDDGATNGTSLYEPGGAYAKLDQVCGLQPSGAPFDGRRHLDARDHAPFVPPAAERALYDPSTVRGFAYCYQRTTNPDLGWTGHCGGATIAASLYRPPQGRTVRAPDGTPVHFSTEEVEGILAAYFEGQQVDTETYFQGCPAGPPTVGTGSLPNLDFTNRYADDFWRGLVEGIGQGHPLVADLRAEDGVAAQNWNHVVHAFSAELQGVPGSPELVLIDVTIWASQDVFPSPESQARRQEVYRFRLGCRDGAVVPDHPGQDWLAATRYAPRYLYRVKSAYGDSDRGCKNEPLGRQVGLAKLEQLFGLERR